MKLQYSLKNGKKIYTLKPKHNGIPTKPAHYKFKKTKDVVKTR